MTWTAIPDLSTGDSVTETHWDTHLKANLEHLYAKFATALDFETAISELTISSGAVTITGPVHSIDTEGDGASDDLDTISGGTARQLLIVVPNHTDRTVVLKHSTGNIHTYDGNDVSLDSTDKYALLYYDGSNWFVLGGAGTGGLEAGDSAELTIATGAVTVSTGWNYTIDTEGDGASDDLDTISGGTDGKIIVIRQENAARQVTVTENGNIHMLTSQSFSLGSAGAALLVSDGTNWFAVPMGDAANDTLEINTLKLDDDEDSILLGATTGDISYDDSGTYREILAFSHTATAVNEVGVTNAATGGNPKLDAQGGDANINLRLEGKGTGEPSVPELRIGDDAATGYAKIYDTGAISSGALAGASDTIEINVPAGATLLCGILDVVTGVEIDDNPGAWDADFSGGNSESIGTAYATDATNQKFGVNAGKCTAEVDITLTPNAGSAFTSGEVQARVWYILAADISS